jgi:hypothetical protein
MYRGAKGIIKFGDRYLVGKRNDEFHLLGGRRDFNELPFETFERELCEESSCVFTITYDYLINKSNRYKIKFIDRIYNKKYNVYLYIYDAGIDVDEILLNRWNKQFNNNQNIIILHVLSLIKEPRAKYILLYEYYNTREKKYLEMMDIDELKLKMIYRYAVYFENHSLCLATKEELIDKLYEKSILNYI